MQESIGIYLALENQSKEVKNKEDLKLSHLEGFERDNKNLGIVRDRRRLSNYIFKNPLTIFKKVLLDLFVGNDFLQKQVKLICLEKNLTTFPKLVCLCQREGVKSQAYKNFQQAFSDFLQKRQKNLTVDQRKDMNNWGRKMSQGLNCQNMEQVVHIYWGEKVRHKDKLEKCLNQIKKLKQFNY